MNTLQTIESLAQFQKSAKPEDFEIFGVLSDHLWRKFVGYDYDVIRFWQTLDMNNRQILANHIESK